MFQTQKVTVALIVLNVGGACGPKKKKKKKKENEEEAHVFAEEENEEAVGGLQPNLYFRGFVGFYGLLWNPYSLGSLKISIDIRL